MASEFAQFMEEHPTVFHFTQGIADTLNRAGFLEIFESDFPRLERGGRYYVNRNDSNLIAFEIGENFVPGLDGFVVSSAHIDANRLSLKPSSLKPSVAGYERLGAAVYGGPKLASWFDRDLGLGGRAVVRTKHGIEARLVRLPGTVGTIPSLAPHFGDTKAPNLETNFVPIVGASGTDASAVADAPAVAEAPAVAGGTEAPDAIRRQHSAALLEALAAQLHCAVDDILELELELFSSERPTIGGLRGDMLMCSRMDDRLCAYTSVLGLVASAGNADHAVKMVALYDNEEVGSLTRTGGYNKLMEVVMGVVHESLGSTRDERVQSAANSLSLSADVTHAVNPNYTHMYAEGHMPRLNTGMTVKQLGRFTSNAIDAALCQLVAEKSGIPLQRFAPRNDTRSGGTIGPMRAASLGIRTIDIGIPVLAMHSVREVTGVEDIPLGIKWFKAYFELANELVLQDV